MPWQSNTYVRTNGDHTGSEIWQEDAAEGIKIIASRMDVAGQDMADGITACVKKDGTNATNVVKTAWIEDAAVTAAKLADGAVGATAKIADGIITEAKLADDAASRSTLITTFSQSVSSSTGVDGSGLMFLPEGIYLLASGRSAGSVNLMAIPKALKITHLTLSASDAPGTGDTLTARVVKNGVTTSDPVTISGNSQTYNHAAITAFSITAGDFLGATLVLTGAAVDFNMAVVLHVWGHFTA